MTKRILYILLTAILLLIAGFITAYSAWNGANPEKTCARCHEINPSYDTWTRSAHREIACEECHGTAMSNGFHSMKQKTGMLFSHMKEEKQNRDIRMTEEQIIETMHRCVNCHQEEYKKWQSGGHSATYAQIFLNDAHNSMEQPYWDCFRCHGMHYEGSIYDLIEPVSNTGPWKMKDGDKQDDPVITCLACHEIHSDNKVHKQPESMEDPDKIFYERKESSKLRNPKAGLYVRADKIYLRADQLPKPAMYDGGREVRISNDPIQRICVQCHAPNYSHQAGTQDDRTLSGVHEGLSCTACHETHSNDASNACTQCHPTIGNCGQDHMKMNTSYFNPESQNDIHHVKCSDCHDEAFLAAKQR
ncbi:multiheme c-type cytochrome [Bacteroidota bacterium]